jgi:hypothetical protein
MISSVKDVEYFSIVVADKPGEARKLLEFLSEKSVNLLALTAFPLGGGESRIDFFPEDPSLLREAAEDAEVPMAGPKIPSEAVQCSHQRSRLQRCRGRYRPVRIRHLGRSRRSRGNLEGLEKQ